MIKLLIGGFGSGKTISCKNIENLLKLTERYDIKESFAINQNDFIDSQRYTFSTVKIDKEDE